MITFKKARNQNGATAIELGMITAVISVAIITGVSYFKGPIQTAFATEASMLASHSAVVGQKTDFINSIQSSSKDDFDMTYVDVSEGGTNVAGDNLWNAVGKSHIAQANAERNIQALTKLNSEDAITGVFGLYDDYSTPLHSLDEAISHLENGKVKAGKTAHTSDAGNIEVTTSSGKVFLLNAGNLTENN